jgi:hypothetical protein
MTQKPYEGRARERGMSLVLVLVFLAFGSLAIPPTLNYVITGLKAAHISEEQLLRQYAADSAVEYSRWQLTSNIDGIRDTLTLSNPSYSSSVTVNGIVVPYTITVAQSAVGGAPGPIGPISSGILGEAILQVTPTWAPSGVPVDFTFTVHFRNIGTSAIHLKGLRQLLPPHFLYIQNSYVGPNAVFTKQLVVDRWELNWNFKSPLPVVASGETYIMSLGARSTPPVGAYDDFGQGWVYYSSFGVEQTLSIGTLGQVTGIGLYDITASAGSYRIQGNVGIYDSGVEVNSYQVK